MLTAHPAAEDLRIGVRHRGMWRVITALEVAAASATVLLDLLVPSLVMLALMALSLLARHQGFASLGCHRVRVLQLAATMFAVAAGWSLIQLSITMPVANHVSGKRTDLSDFADVEGNLPKLLLLLLLSWTVAAVGEELAYRGYLQTRLRQLLGHGRAGLISAVIVSSVLFGVAHTEQGLVGALTITLDGVVFSALRYRYQTLWASVLAHGFNNTIGFVTFFFAGPVYGFW
jgi:uncharacterized protein